MFRKNFIVPYLGGPNALATPPPRSFHRFLLLFRSFFFLLASKKKRMEKKKQLPQAWDLSGPTCARVTKSPLDTQWPICAELEDVGWARNEREL